MWKYKGHAAVPTAARGRLKETVAEGIWHDGTIVSRIKNIVEANEDIQAKLYELENPSKPQIYDRIGGIDKFLYRIS